MKTQLNSEWTLSFTHPVSGEQHCIPATVPGNVEIDLLREGSIDDPYPTDCVTAMRDFERVDDWVYTTEFDAPVHSPGEAVELVFEGIDTIADVRLNGEPLLWCENMHIPHRVEVTDRLRPTGNALEVHIHSPELYARRFAYPPGQASRDHRQAEAYLRKARHMWGWDNAPRLLSAGIWRPVRLDVLPTIRFTDVYVYTRQVTEESVSIGCNWAVETPDHDLSGYRGVMRLALEGQVRHELDFDVEFTAGRMHTQLSRDAVQLWWPRGYGEPVLYDLSLVLLRDDETVAEWNGRFGIREIELVMSEVTDAEGSGELVFVCNGEKIYINGTNWKPLDALHSQAGKRLPQALDMCLDLNCNMVRIWGGGVYEDHEFFDICDAKGLLVWQDFMFACEFPPRDAAFLARVRVEAETIVRRLRNHASLAVWCGDNEVDDMFGWGNSPIAKHMLPSDNRVSREVLRNAVLDHDPYRSYVPSSPYVSDVIVCKRRVGRGGPPCAPAGNAAGAAPGTAAVHVATPERHLYPGNENFREAYRNSPAHFIGETGPFFINAMSQSPDIVARDLPRARRLWDAEVSSYILDRHQTDADFLTWKDATRKRLQHLFGRQFGLDDWEEMAFAANILCGEIFKYAIEYSRAHKWRKTGVLWWSLLDMWPMMFNYSVVDYNFRPKQPAYDWIRQSQQRFCLMVVEAADGTRELFAANDTLAAQEGSYRIVGVAGDGQEEGRQKGCVEVAPNASQRLGTVSPKDGPELWLIEWTIGHRTACNHYVCAEPPVRFEVYRGWCERIAARVARARPRHVARNRPLSSGRRRASVRREVS